MDRIFIKGLKVECIIGILPHERVHRQELVADIELEHDLRAAAQSGDLSRSINYAEVAQAAKEFITARQAQLVETLAEELCALILKRFQPNSVTLTLSKTHAVADTAGVGVKISRSLKELQC